MHSPISEGFPLSLVNQFLISKFISHLFTELDLSHRFCSQTTYIQTQVNYVPLCKLLYHSMPSFDHL